jgi:hypothetical protein
MPFSRRDLSADLPLAPLEELSNQELLRRLHALVDAGRKNTAALLLHLAEVDQRRLYLEQACSSLFSYCTERLHFSEGAAYKHIRAARLVRRFPAVLDRLARGELHLSGLSILAPHLDEDNCDELLSLAVHKSKRVVEELMATRFPKPDAKQLIRRLPGSPRASGPEPIGPGQTRELKQPADRLSPGTAGRPESRAATAGTVPPVAATAGTAPPVAATVPLSAGRYKVQLTASARLKHKIDRARDLMRHQNPRGDLEVLFERALDQLLAHLERQRLGSRSAGGAEEAAPLTVRAEGKRSRYIPVAIRRAVWERDGGRCSFVDATSGRRCTETGWLEFHHHEPFARGGGHQTANLSLMCKAHNVHIARRELEKEALSLHPA